MQTVLITGAAGFVGSHLIELLAADHPRIVGWQRPGTVPLATVEGVEWNTVEMHDTTEVARALEAASPSSIYHLAGSPHVGDSWNHVTDTFAGNVLTTLRLFDGLRATGQRPRVLVTGSAMVYQPSDLPLTERDAVWATSPYATSKIAQEMLSQRAWKDDGLPVLMARAFNHVGPRQSPTFVAAGIARQIALAEGGQRSPVLSLGNLTPRRDIMDVRDTVRAYQAMMKSATPGVPYNVCSGTTVAIQELVDLFRQHARVPIRIEQDPTKFRPNDTKIVCGDPTRLRNDTGWTPSIPLDQTVTDLLDYWRRSAE